MSGQKETYKDGWLRDIPYGDQMDVYLLLRQLLSNKFIYNVDKNVHSSDALLKPHTVV